MSRSVAFAALFGLCLPLSAEAASWEQVIDDQNIVVWQREIAGTSLVEFKGKGVVDASYQKILAVLYDHKRKTEWMQNCVNNRRVRLYSPGHAVFYNRTGSSWPLVSDRDVVLESQVAIWREKGQVKIDIWSVEDKEAPVVDGVVRMPKLTASWILIALDENRTEVTYQVQADPGGSLPDWVVNIVAKKIPFHTIANLKTQTQKTGYDEQLDYVQSVFDWEGFLYQTPEKTPAGPRLNP